MERSALVGSDTVTILRLPSPADMTSSTTLTTRSASDTKSSGRGPFVALHALHDHRGGQGDEEGHDEEPER
jgi:hypothetical protein